MVLRLVNIETIIGSIAQQIKFYMLYLLYNMIHISKKPKGIFNVY